MSYSKSLQVKITLLVGLVVTAACLLLTFSSIFSAFHYYSPFLYSVRTDTTPDLSGEVSFSSMLGIHNSPTATKSQATETRPDSELDTTTYSQEYGIEVVRASRRFSVQNILVMVGIILLAVGFTYWLTGKALRSLKTLNKSINEMDGHNLAQRVPQPTGQDETAQLTNSFNQMLDRLEAAFLMQKRFAANAAHELKTPLTVMKTSLEVLKLDGRPSQEDYQEFAEDTEQAVNRLIVTVDSLLALSKAAATEEATEVSLQATAAQANRGLAAKAAEAGIEVSITGQDATVIGNPSLLYRIVYNLLDNAIKYNKPRGRVEINTALTPEGNACLIVSDTGIGMTEEDLQHLFEPFYRADASRSQTIPGSGLGMSIVQLLAEQQGGSIEAASKIGEGSQMKVFFKKI